MLTPCSNHPVRVIQILPTLQRRGLEKVVCDIALGLHGHGYEIEVCCQRATGPLEEVLRIRGIRVYCLGEKGPHDLMAARRLFSILRRGEYDIAHLHCAAATGYQIPTVWLAQVPKIICTFHSTPGLPAPPAVRAKAAICRLVTAVVSRYVDWVYGCSAIALSTHEQNGWRGCESSVIYNGVNLKELRPAADKATAKAAFGIAASRPVIGSVGSLQPVKGYANLIRAFALVRRELPDACLLLLGSGPDAVALARLAQASGSGDAVRFLGERENATECLHAMDVFALPSLTEGLPLALMEAMACGIPVVASAVGGVPEVATNEVSGLLVPPEDDATLAAALLRILIDHDLAKNLSAKALEKVSVNFAIGKMIKQVSDLYLGLSSSLRAGSAISPD